MITTGSPEALNFERMTPEQFQEFKARSIEDFASQIQKAEHLDADEARQLAREKFEVLLFQGVETPEHHFLLLRAGLGPAMGHLWFRVPPGSRPAFLYDLEIYETYQGRGLGRAAMLHFEESVKALGAHQVALHVFGHNQRALRLYESLGYQTSSLNLRKELL